MNNTIVITYKMTEDQDVDTRNLLTQAALETLPFLPINKYNHECPNCGGVEADTQRLIDFCYSYASKKVPPNGERHDFITWRELRYCLKCRRYYVAEVGEY